MKNLFFALLISSFLFSCNANDNKKAVSEKDNYEKTKENLADKEKKNPQDFLTVSGHEIGRASCRERV